MFNSCAQKNPIYLYIPFHFPLSIQLVYSLQQMKINLFDFSDLEVLTKPKWKDQMEPNDFRALSPLIYKHINPYGKFELNMNERIELNFN